MSIPLDTDTISPPEVKGTYPCMRSNICFALQGYELYNQKLVMEKLYEGIMNGVCSIFGVWDRA